MASTRNRNTPEDFALEQSSLKRQFEYQSYTNFGTPQTPLLAGNGLLPGHMASYDLAHNASDIESYLWGIGSTNLVTPQDPVKPQIKNIPSLNIVPLPKLYLPDPLVIEAGQRHVRQ